MEFRVDISVKETLIQAGKRIDGIAMYIGCCFFLFFALYAVVAREFNLPFFLPYWKGISSILLIPVIFVSYVRLAYFSTSGIFSRFVNAIILLGIPSFFIVMTSSIL